MKATIRKGRCCGHPDRWTFYHGFCRGINDTQVCFESWEDAIHQFVYHQKWHAERLKGK